MNMLTVSNTTYDISRFRLFAQKNGLTCTVSETLGDCHRYLNCKNTDIILFDRNIIGQGNFSVYNHLREVLFKGIALVYNDTAVTGPLRDYWKVQNKDRLSDDDSAQLTKIIAEIAELLESTSNGLKHILPDIHEIRPQSRKLLDMFMKENDGVLNIRTIACNLWGDYREIKKSSIYACICELRKLLEKQAPGTIRLIKTGKETYMLKIQDFTQDSIQ